MSMFTDFNAPGNGMSGANTQQLLKLINAYEELVKKLNTHIVADTIDNETSGVTDAHGFKKALSNLEETLKKEIADKYATEESIKDLQSSEQVTKAISTAISALNLDTTYVNKDSIVKYQTAEQVTKAISTAISALDLDTTYEEIGAANNLEEKINTIGLKKIVATTIYAGEYIKGILHTKNYIDFTEWAEVQAQYAGTGIAADSGTNGLYVIAKLSDIWESPKLAVGNYKAARLFIKYVNKHNFDAILDIVATVGNDNKLQAVITASVTKEENSWNNLAFHIVEGSKDGVKSCYIAVSADGLATEIKGESTQITFKVCGINALPLDPAVSIGIVEEVAGTAKINASETSTFIVSKISAGTILADAIKSLSGKSLLEIYNDKLVFSERPMMRVTDETGEAKYYNLISEEDLRISNVPVGGIIEWPFVEEIKDKDGTVIGSPAIDVPDGWLSCRAEDYNEENLEGIEIDKESYPDLAEIVGDRVPVRDYAIIHAKYWDTISEDIKEKLTPTFLKQYIDSAIDKLKAETQRAKTAERQNASNIVTETERAQKVESSLKRNIFDEQSRAQVAESDLSTAITQEAAIREVADNERYTKDEADNKFQPKE